MAKKKGSGFGKLLGAAAIASIAKIISDLNKKAKKDGKDILDVAKEKMDDIVEDAKSGELADKAKEAVGKAGESIGQFAQDVKSGKLVDDVKSGKMAEDVKTKFSETVDKVKSEEFKNEAASFAQNLKEGVIDIFDGKNDDNKA